MTDTYSLRSVKKGTKIRLYYLVPPPLVGTLEQVSVYTSVDETTLRYLGIY